MNRRQKLIWFAAGAFVSGTILTASNFYLRPGPLLDDTTTQYLVLEEPNSDSEWSEAPSSDKEAPSQIAYRTGEIMRLCDAEYFEIDVAGDDRHPIAMLPMIELNFDALACVYRLTEAEDIRTRFEFKWGDANDDYFAARRAFEPATR